MGYVSAHRLGRVAWLIALLCSGVPSDCTVRPPTRQLVAAWRVLIDAGHPLDPGLVASAMRRLSHDHAFRRLYGDPRHRQVPPRGTVVGIDDLWNLTRSGCDRARAEADKGRYASALRWYRAMADVSLAAMAGRVLSTYLAPELGFLDRRFAAGPGAVAALVESLWKSLGIAGFRSVLGPARVAEARDLCQALRKDVSASFRAPVQASRGPESLRRAVVAARARHVRMRGNLARLRAALTAPGLL